MQLLMMSKEMGNNPNNKINITVYSVVSIYLTVANSTNSVKQGL